MSTPASMRLETALHRRAPYSRMRSSTDSSLKPWNASFTYLCLSILIMFPFTCGRVTWSGARFERLPRDEGVRRVRHRGKRTLSTVSPRTMCVGSKVNSRISCGNAQGSKTVWQTQFTTH